MSHCRNRDVSVALKPGDEALLLTLSFSVLLAWAEDIPPLPEDWRCVLLRMRSPEESPTRQEAMAISMNLLSEEPV